MKLKIYAKTADSFSMSIYNKQGDPIKDYDSYPPVKKGLSRDGDSVEMTIDNETGQIIGWVPFTDDEIKEL